MDYIHVILDVILDKLLEQSFLTLGSWEFEYTSYKDRR